MKKIYLILTHTGTILSTIIKQYTKDEYSHVSIALDEELHKMYSFGRLNPYNPFWGGFVHEGIARGTFKRFKNTTTEIYSLKITDEQYEKLKKVIRYFNNNKEKYKFNTIGLACVRIRKKITLKNTFYCAEFVRHVLKSARIQVGTLPEIIKPEDFKDIDGIKLEYQGLLRKYNKADKINIMDILNKNEISYV